MKIIPISTSFKELDRRFLRPFFTTSKSDSKLLGRPSNSFNESEINGTNYWLLPTPLLKPISAPCTYLYIHKKSLQVHESLYSSIHRSNNQLWMVVSVYVNTYGHTGDIYASFVILAHFPLNLHLCFASVASLATSKGGFWNGLIALMGEIQYNVLVLSN